MFVKQITIDKTCDVCGKLISGDHVEIKTRGGNGAAHPL